jgi:hypothetical protein
MPVILDPDGYDLWVDPGIASQSHPCSSTRAYSGNSICFGGMR